MVGEIFKMAAPEANKHKCSNHRHAPGAKRQARAAARAQQKRGGSSRPVFVSVSVRVVFRGP